MGNSSAKNNKETSVPGVEVTHCTVHEYILDRIKSFGDKVAQVDALTGEEVTFTAILERSAALAAGLSARGLRAGEAAIIIGENSVHYPWLLLGVLQTGASAHLIDPRSTAREVEHAVSISKPVVALVSSSVSQQSAVTRVLREAISNVLVWGEPRQVAADGADDPREEDLPDCISSLERLLVSPAKSASSIPCSPAGPNGEGQLPGYCAKSVLSGLGTPSAPPPTPTSLGATYGDSCSPSGASPLQKLLPTAVDGVPRPQPLQQQGGSGVALILPSSGTTGLPKGVMISHDNLLAALDLRDAFMQENDVALGMSPYFHAFGGTLMLMSLCSGTRMVALGRFSMGALLDAIEKHKITVMHVVSSLLVSLGKLPAESLAKMSSVRHLWSGAGQTSALVQSALQARLPGAKLFHCFGMTETTFTTMHGEVRADKPGSPGTLVQKIECRVVDPETGSTLPAGSKGELLFKGPMVTRGYLCNPEATSEAFTADGWLRSGDLGFVDEDGYYFIVDRLKDVLKYNGFQVSPSELEALLMSHPAVKEAAVIGEPHEYGEAPRALIVLGEGQQVTEEELQKFIEGKVAPYKQLRGGITFVDTPFPRTASGKLQRRKLRALLQGANDSIISSSSISEPSSPTSTAAELTPVATQVEAKAGEEPEAQPSKPVGVTAPTADEANPSAQLIASEAESVVQAVPDSSTSTPKAEAGVAEQNGALSSPEPQTQPPTLGQQHRPSLASVSSLSTIYSESPLSSPAIFNSHDETLPMPGTWNGDEALATPATRLREAAKVPLPDSEPNSPAYVSEGNVTQGSCPMDIESPFGERCKEENMNYTTSAMKEAASNQSPTVL